jgi:hypothetical protein
METARTIAALLREENSQMDEYQLAKSLSKM